MTNAVASRSVRLRQVGRHPLRWVIQFAVGGSALLPWSRSRSTRLGMTSMHVSPPFFELRAIIRVNRYPTAEHFGTISTLRLQFVQPFHRILWYSVLDVWRSTLGVCLGCTLRGIQMSTSLRCATARRARSAKEAPEIGRGNCFGEGGLDVFLLRRPFNGHSEFSPVDSRRAFDTVFIK